ncbi:MAG: hypothetical protein EA419_05545 [Wenzhouxiangella sp.]|nr:MAG: hypothetical protein EA419_05545 [Wenzhouxiangella sp.]
MHSDLIDALRDPARYPHPVDEVDVLETHISWVLLAGDWVYKIKKPVDFGFLDFSTLALREHFCREELRLNRRHAADLYDAVVAVTGAPEEPVLGGTGEPLEFAVRMHRFDQDSRFDQLLEAGRLAPGRMDELAEELAALHELAERAGPAGEFGTPAQVVAPMRDNFATLLDCVESPERRRLLNQLGQWTEAQFERLAGRLQERLEHGFVRECHGDVHLGNVALLDDSTILFDCLEFSPELRWTDVIADLAFAVMDLRDRGAERLSWRLLDRYLARTGDYGGLDLLAFYTVYRAMVRAKVAALSLADAADEAQRQHLAGEVDNYLALARSVASTRRPALVLTCGVSGSGKSWLSERLVERPGLVRVRSDVERKRLHGLAGHASSDSGLGRGLYSAEATEKTYARLAELAEGIVRAGYPVLIDATFLEQDRRARFAALAGELEVAFGILACTAEVDVLKERIKGRVSRGKDASEADLAVLARQLEAVQPCAPGEGDLLTIDTGQPDAVDRAAGWLEELISGR